MPHSILQLAEQLEAETFRIIQALPNAKWTDLGDCCVLHTGVPQALYNGIFLLRWKDAKSAQRRLLEVRDQFFADQLPFTVHQAEPCTPAPADLDPILSGLGGKAQAPAVIITGDLPTSPSLSLPPGYTMERVTTRAQVDSFCKMMTLVFELPEIFGTAFTRWYELYGTARSNPYQSYLYHHEGALVAIAANYLCLADPTLGTAMNFGVHPEHRKRKHGTVLIPHLIATLATRGAKRAITSGTPDGMRVYRKYNVKELGWCRRWEFLPA